MSEALTDPSRIVSVLATVLYAHIIRRRRNEAKRRTGKKGEEERGEWEEGERRRYLDWRRGSGEKQQQRYLLLLLYQSQSLRTLSHSIYMILIRLVASCIRKKDTRRGEGKRECGSDSLREEKPRAVLTGPSQQ